MVQFEELPDGWHEIEYETGPQRGDGPYTEELTATWASDDEQILVQAEQSVDVDGTVTYPVTVEQHIEDTVDGQTYSTSVQSHARIADDRRDVEEMAVEFMEGVNDNRHKLRVIGVQTTDDRANTTDFVQFFTVSDSDLPANMTGDQLVDLLNAEDYQHRIDELPDEISRELANEEMIQVHIFPRHKDEVTMEEADKS